MMLDFSIINLCKISVVIHSNFSKQIEMTCQLRNVGFSPFIDFIGGFFLDVFVFLFIIVKK